MFDDGKSGSAMVDDTPLYNLKAVTNEVGLSPETLRAWERRYGLVKPQRTPGGHRLYSRRDIEILKWLVERQNEGLSISHAVELWNKLAESGQVLPQGNNTPALLTSAGENMLSDLRDQWIAACLAFDDLAANRVIDQAFSIATPEAICTQVFQKGLSQIGERWYAGDVRVQQEHFASQIAIRRVNTLLAAATPPTRSGHILAACPPDEEHDFVLLMITYLLRRRGWDVIYLGSNVPLNDLDTTIKLVAPILVISAAQTLNGAASLRKMSAYLDEKGVPLAFGGGIFTLIPAAIHAITGHYLGDELENVTMMVDRLVADIPPMPAAQPISPQYAHALTSFLHNETLITGFVESMMQVDEIKPVYLETALLNLSRSISSALVLGDINYLDHSIIWLKGLLNNRGLSNNLVRQFLSLYNQSVKHYLGEAGEVIQDMLVKHISPAGQPDN